MSADMTRYTEPFQVYRHDGDCFGYVQPASVLRYAQQIAGEHAIALGITDEVYARTHTAYVLAKQALHFERVPRVDVEEKVTGTGIYPDDIYLDGMIYGSAVRSQYPRARCWPSTRRRPGPCPVWWGSLRRRTSPGRTRWAIW